MYHKQYYQTIAEEFDKARRIFAPNKSAVNSLRFTALGLATKFRQQDKRFNTTQFIRACGFEE